MSPRTRTATPERSQAVNEYVRHPYDQKRETESESDVNRRQIDEHLMRASARVLRSGYELRVTNEPDQDGWYVARVYHGGHWMQSFINQDRDKVKEQGRAYVEWAKTADSSVETIVL